MHMTTQEFFQVTDSPSTDDRVLTINSASVLGDRLIINGLTTTMGAVFTDDHIPIERIVHDMVVRFVLEGGMKYIE